MQLRTLNELIDTLEGLIYISNVQQNLYRGPFSKEQMIAALEGQRTEWATDSAIVSVLLICRIAHRR